jgi:hypothetical protein
MAYTTVDNPELYFQTKLYTGNSGTNAITLDGSENMQPDWIWIKERGATGFHVLTDVVRGITKQLYTNDNQVENTNSFSITAIGSNGFTLGNRADVNNNSDTYVAWNWLAGGTASSNTDGSITSTVSANTTSGFSIVSYSGTGSNLDFGHGLGAVPDWFMIKNRDVDQAWRVYHKSIGFTKRLVLSETGAESASAVGLNGSPSSSLIYLDTSTDCTNASGQDYICYAFAEKKGFSKFGSYTGNGNADGTFVYTGFKPAMVIRKVTSTTGGWLIQDNTRTPFNGLNSNTNALRPSTSEAEFDFYDIDYLSNGFKIRTSEANHNQSGQTFIYMAFAENPFVTSTGIPTTAR